MAKWRVHVVLDETYDGDEAIEADTEEEAFIAASDAAMGGGSWYWDAELLNEDGEEECGE